MDFCKLIKWSETFKNLSKLFHSKIIPYWTPSPKPTPNPAQQQSTISPLLFPAKTPYKNQTPHNHSTTSSNPPISQPWITAAAAAQLRRVVTSAAGQVTGPETVRQTLTQLHRLIRTLITTAPRNQRNSVLNLGAEMLRALVKWNRARSRRKCRKRGRNWLWRACFRTMGSDMFWSIFLRLLSFTDAVMR